MNMKKERRVNYELDMNIEEAVKLFDYVGYVYPDDSESYYIDSNIQCDLVDVCCNDGYFYGDYETAREIAYHEYFVERKETSPKPRTDDGFDDDFDFDEVEEY